MSPVLLLLLACTAPPEAPRLADVGFPEAAGAPRAKDPFGRVRVTLGEHATRVQLTGGGELGMAGPAPLGPWEGACAPGQTPCRGRAERRVEGGLREWWASTSLGLEHGFTAEAGGARLRVPVHLDGASASVDAGGRDARLRSDGGATVGYRALAAVDAEGRSLPARFVLEGRTLWIEVDSSAATFPVEIDPLLSGDWATYAYSGDELLVLPDVNGDGYDELVIGDSYDERSTSTDDTGVVHVFYGGLGGPSSTPDLTWYASTAEGHAPSALAGGDLDGDGYGDLVIGASDYSSYGRLWVMYGSATGLPSTEDESVYLSSLTDLGAGLAVADFDMDGFDDVVAAAYGTTTAVMLRGGASGLSSTESWSTTAAAVYAAQVREGDFDGDGDPDLVLALPAYSYGQSNEGMLWRYDNDGTGLATTAAWSWDSDVTGAYCGWSLASGDLDADGADDLALGCRYQDVTYTDEGRVYAFYGDAWGFAASPDWHEDGGGANMNFGARVAVIRDADGDGDAELAASGNYGSGVVMAWNGRPEGLSDVPTVSWGGDGDYAYWGEALAGGGDLDGDGLGDAAMSVLDAGSSSSTGDYWSGYTVLFLGDDDGLLNADDLPDDRVEPGWDTTYFGRSIASAGDFDRDGADDLVVGVAGYAYTYEGGAAGPRYTTSSRYVDYYAGALDAAGDVTGDGVPDLVLGAPYYRVSSTYVGALVFFRGSSSGPATAATSSITGTGNSASSSADGYAEEVAHLGDLNGDGYGDVGVGYRRYDGGITDQGAVYVYYGSSAGPSATGATSLYGGEDSGFFGDTVRGADLNEDGYADLVVSSPYWDGDLPDQGRVQVFYGSASGVATTAGWEMQGGAEDALLGILLDVADANGDGLPDLAVFAGGDEEVRIHAGDGDAFADEAGTTVPVPGFFASQTRIRWIGDMDGDGDRELAVGYDGDFGVAVYPGVAGGIDGTPMIDVEDVVVGASCGWDFIGVDVDGNGLGDLVVGCPDLGDDGALLTWFGEAVDRDGDGHGTDTDCDDGDASVYPGAAEVCDGIDNNCDGAADEAAPTWYADGDGDGHGDPSRTTAACDAPIGWVAGADDCDDADASTFPGAVETCDGVDDDCDGAVDEAGATGEGTWYLDADGDGHGGSGGTVAACSEPAGYAAGRDDCDDGDAETHPGADERCDGEDDDCDGATDEAGAVDAPAWYRDADRDGYGDAADLTRACTAPTGRVADDTDCDDGRADIRPGAPETCDGQDDDCDGLTDEADATDADTWYADPDGDGYGDAAVSAPGCAAPAGYVADATDCDSGSRAVNPGATEACNGLDDNCDGATDEAGATGEVTWHRDGDGDGFGTVGATVDACTRPSGYVADGTDCDDTDAGVHPGAAESCNDADDNCDGVADEGTPSDAPTWYRDADSDGFGVEADTARACTTPAGYAAVGGDCDDTLGTVNPSAVEQCNADDDDCDGVVDDGLATSTWYADADADGYGDPLTAEDACAQAEGRVADGTDCDDGNATVNPGVSERWYDGEDAACDGGSDYDADGDGQDSATYGGGDCDDSDPGVYTGAPDDPYDGRVTDCASAGEYDADGDGHTADSYGGDDCDDANAQIHPGATEAWYDGVDQDCDGNDDDQDGDGVGVATDCDDEDPTRTDCDGEDTGGGGDSGDDSGGEPKPTGCGCATPGGGGAAPLAAWVLLALGLRRRRA